MRVRGKETRKEKKKGGKGKETQSPRIEMQLATEEKVPRYGIDRGRAGRVERERGPKEVVRVL